MRIQQSSRQGLVVLALAGRLDLAAAPQVQRAILKQLAQQPAAIICDLSQVEAIDPLCAGVFTSIRHAALGWPGTALVLSGTRPAVADTLVQLGVAQSLPMYTSLDQALANACARPPRLRARLTLGPVPTTAAAGRQFVGEVCGHWGLRVLAEPAALLASELVTNAVVHAHTALELRVELRGSRLQVAVHDQNPNVAGLLAAKDGTDRGLGLQIVDQVAKAWGVRQDGAGGMTIWCTLDLPASQADTIGQSREPQASTGTAAKTAGMDAADHRRPDTMTTPGSVLIWTKLRAPVPRAGLIPRAGLLALLQAGLEGGKLCLVDAPAGFGKTTLLTQWRAADGGGRVAWVTLDEGDNDPTRFWVYVIEAFRVVEPGLGAASLDLLQGAGSADVLTQVVLPQLLNELAASGDDLVLVLDDYHLVTNGVCHASLGFFIDHLPANVHLVLSTRVDPPLRLARLRASGALTELRTADLGFTSTEATALLNQSMGLELTAQQTQRLWERTEGWAAGLVLAGLSLQGRSDPGSFIASFEAGHRHVVDYLGSEVLAAQPEPLRAFLVRTSVLQRLSASLCDAVLEADNSGEVLAELEQANLFLIALDDHRRWYRYHHLFGQLLALELAEREPELVPVLHRRAAAWYRDAGDISAAIHHFATAGDFAQAGALIMRHWVSYERRGRAATVQRWLDGLPEDFVAANPPIALVAAWVGGQGDASIQEIERWLVAAEASDYQGPLPPEMGSVPFLAALVRAINTSGDIGRSLQAARQALEAAGPGPSEPYWMGATAVGRSLYLSGQVDEARAVLEDVARHGPAPDKQPHVVVNTFALLSLLAGEDGEDERALALARQAMDAADVQGVRYDPLTGVAYIALARSTARCGGLAEAEQLLEQALQVLRTDNFRVQYAQAMVELAGVRHARGDTDEAHALVERAHQLITTFTDPGMLPSLLDQTERALGRPTRRRPSPAAELTDRELVVLRLLPTKLSQPEMAQELYLSVNTVRTHIQGIYRKLEVTSRVEAVDTARQLSLIPQG